MIRIFSIVLLLSVLQAHYAAADALPSFESSQKITIDFKHQDPGAAKDTIHAILLRNGTADNAPFDTFIVENDYGSFDRMTSMDYSKGNLKLHVRKRNWCQIKLLLLSNGKLIESPILTNPNAMDSYFVLTVYPHSIIDSTPFFKTHWSEFFLQLFVTIALKVVFATTQFKRWKLPYERNLLMIAIATLISYLLVWIACAYFIGFGLIYVFAQIGVVLFEAWWFWFFTKHIVTFDRSLRLSVRLNGWSFIIIGIILFYVKG